ncbi:HpcH/HpaI aldolase/citrate lyase family protein [Nocardioides panzhihuensis]|uniref:Citrate lyase subunit beta/citryl-CoA lyase n=1 Tax=Nocardioides panzhihuensis TaxID=860243 RepID=A0A7Z0ITH5_9ACTN|nr:CoA ester lyase [Nocardioides panzhihuensis]NYI78862.1 citrate lyase subunit beta/citryl-CoA lyase [Nocardioides panzhihuensis]
MSTAEIAGTARTWLFVPGNRPERFDKAAAAGPDVVVLDLEDAVAPAHKDAARAHVTDWLPQADVTVAVRINAAATIWHDADLAALAALDGPSLVMLPKADSPETVAAVLAALPDGSAVVALVETALGVAGAIDLARSPGVVRLAFGSFDLAAELGVDPDHAPALAPARGKLVLASAVGELAGPIDGVTGDVRDHERLAEDVTAAAALGFAGKLCIHPGQVAPAAVALAPTPDEVAWAERVLAAATEDGVALVDGRMVDAPVVARARRIISLNRPIPGAPR